MRGAGVSLTRPTSPPPQYNDDGTPKSVENLAMYTEMYSKLALKKVQRTQLATQLKQLGEVRERGG